MICTFSCLKTLLSAIDAVATTLLLLCRPSRPCISIWSIFKWAIFNSKWWWKGRETSLTPSSELALLLLLAPLRHNIRNLLLKAVKEKKANKICSEIWFWLSQRFLTCRTSSQYPWWETFGSPDNTQESSSEIVIKCSTWPGMPENHVLLWQESFHCYPLARLQRAWENCFELWQQQ